MCPTNASSAAAASSHQRKGSLPECATAASADAALQNCVSLSPAAHKHCRDEGNDLNNKLPTMFPHNRLASKSLRREADRSTPIVNRMEVPRPRGKPGGDIEARRTHNPHMPKAMLPLPARAHNIRNTSGKACHRMRRKPNDKRPHRATCSASEAY